MPRLQTLQKVLGSQKSGESVVPPRQGARWHSEPATVALWTSSSVAPWTNGKICGILDQLYSGTLAHSTVTLWTTGNTSSTLSPQHCDAVWTNSMMALRPMAATLVALWLSGDTVPCRQRQHSQCCSNTQTQS